MRLFVAFDVPGRPDWHMTVVFLGARCGDAPVRAAIDAVELPPVGPLEPRRLIELPRRRPRMLAVEYADPTGRCAALQGLVAAAVGVDERRPWLPHVSIARLRDRPPRPASLEAFAFTPDALTLYESQLGGGRPARYEARGWWPVSSRPRHT